MGSGNAVQGLPNSFKVILECCSWTTWTCPLTLPPNFDLFILAIWWINFRVVALWLVLTDPWPFWCMFRSRSLTFILLQGDVRRFFVLDRIFSSYSSSSCTRGSAVLFIVFVMFIINFWPHLHQFCDQDLEMIFLSKALNYVWRFFCFLLFKNDFFLNQFGLANHLLSAFTFFAHRTLSLFLPAAQSFFSILTSLSLPPYSLSYRLFLRHPSFLSWKLSSTELFYYSFFTYKFFPFILGHGNSLILITLDRLSLFSSTDNDSIFDLQLCATVLQTIFYVSFFPVQLFD